jgi:Cof subfamily protein (haloacid dehalogenase superfamily)
MAAASKSAAVRLLLADVDGTLVTKEKVLTDRAIAAVRNMEAAGIKFAVTSGRPPKGMEMLIKPLALSTPIAAFNGGMFVKPDLSLISEHVLGRQIVEPIIKIMEDHQMAVWIYRGTDWFVHERHGTHVDREEWTVKFPPVVVPSYEGKMDDVAKIVGVSDDKEIVAKCEKAVHAAFGNADVSAALSQPYYLDVTHPEANKGGVVVALARMLDLAEDEIATIGDMPNDISMFKKGGLSIAMGQSSDEVKQAADEVTESCEAEGFALAIERFILQRGA